MKKPTANMHLHLTEADLLLPCPFCGSTELELNNTWTASYWISCDGCSCQVHDPGAGGEGRDPFKVEDHQASKEAAIAAWNQRVSPS